MPRKGPVAKRDVLPDPIYNSKLVTRLINRLMVDGKRGKAATILYNAFDIVKEKNWKRSNGSFRTSNEKHYACS